MRFEFGPGRCMLIFGNFVPTFVSVVFEFFVSVAIMIGSLGWPRVLRSRRRLLAVK
jgi:hypothetical protein